MGASVGVNGQRISISSLSGGVSLVGSMAFESDCIDLDKFEYRKLNFYTFVNDRRGCIVVRALRMTALTCTPLGRSSTTLRKNLRGLLLTEGQTISRSFFVRSVNNFGAACFWSEV